MYLPDGSPTLGYLYFIKNCISIIRITIIFYIFFQLSNCLFIYSLLYVVPAFGHFALFIIPFNYCTVCVIL